MSCYSYDQAELVYNEYGRNHPTWLYAEPPHCSMIDFQCVICMGLDRHPLSSTTGCKLGSGSTEIGAKRNPLSDLKDLPLYIMHMAVI